MKKQLMVCSIFGALVFAGNVMAQCPSNLSVEQQYDCIIMEGARESSDANVLVEQETPDMEVKANDKLASAN